MIDWNKLLRVVKFKSIKETQPLPRLTKIIMTGCCSSNTEKDISKRYWKNIKRANEV